MNHSNGSQFSIGEEVMYDEERFVISEISADTPKRYRLLASTPARVEWAREQDLSKMERYTTPFDDTASY